MSRRISSVRRHTLRLGVGTALGALIAAGAQAQTTPPRLPTPADVDSTRSSLLGPVISSGNGELNVGLRSRSTVIDWKGFNIPEGQRANFTNESVLSGNVAVLNRDISGNTSQLLGALNAGKDVAVWVYNPNGIMVGANAAFNTGSLVLTTLNPDVNDFLSSGNSYRLQGAANSTTGITVMNGARITVSGERMGLVMVAPQIDAAGTFVSAGNTAFVTATDVTLRYRDDSILSVTLNKGTSVPGRSQYVRGSVQGTDALFALASQDNVTDALLQVDASVTAASGGTRGIILSAGKSPSGLRGIDIGGTAADTGGVANLVASGPLRVDYDYRGNGNGVQARATGTAAFTGELRARGDVDLTADGALSVTGAVTAGKDYSLAGSGITLGGADTIVQQAGGSVQAVSTNGDLVGGAGLTLRSGGSESITLSTGGTSAGDIRFAAGSVIGAGDDRRGDLILRRRSDANALALGNVTARSLRGAVGNGATSGTLTTTTALTLGDVDVRQSLDLKVAGLNAGSLASDGGIAVASTGALSAAALNARGDDVALSGTGATTVTGNIRTGNVSDVLITRDGAVSLNTIQAARHIRIGEQSAAASATIAGNVFAGGDYVVRAGTVALGGNGTVTQAANGLVAITGGAGGITGASGLTLTSNVDGVDTNPLTLAIEGTGSGAIAFAADTSLRGGSNRQSNIFIRSADAGGAVSLGRVEANALRGAVGSDGFSTGLTRTGTISVGDVSLNEDLVLRAGTLQAGALRADDGRIALTADTGGITAGTLTARNAVLVDAAGAVALGGDIAAGGVLTIRGASVGLAGTRAQSGGAIDLLARSGGIATSQPLALVSTSRDSRDFVRLQAAGAEGIAFATGSSIVAGDNRALRVGVFNGTADAPLALGDVTARSLSALSALNADATRLGGAITANGDLRFGALNLVDSFAAESLSGNLSVGRIAVTGDGQGISLSAAKGTLSVQNDLSASGDVILASGAGLTLGSVESRAGRASVTSGGAVQLAALRGATGVTAQGTTLAIDAVRGGAVALTATTGTATLGAVTGNGVTVDSAGAMSLTSVDSGGALTLTAGSGGITATQALTANGGIAVTATGGAVSVANGVRGGGAVNVQGQAVTLGGVQQAGQGFVATASNGAVATGAITAGGGITLTGPQGVTADGALVARGGDVRVDGGAAAVTLRGATDASGAVALSGGTITAGGDQRAGAGFSAAASGGPLTLLAVNAAGPVSLTSSGDLSAGAIAATAGDLSVASSAGTVSLNSGAQASGSVTIAGRSLALGGTHSAGGGYTATASAGGITGGNGLSILSDATGSGSRPLALSATGGAVQLGAAPLSGGRGGSSDVTITTDGGGVTVGDVIARRLAVTGPAGSAAAITTGALRLSGDLSLAAAGGVTTGTIDTGTGAVSIDGGASAVSTGAITAGGATTLNGGTLRFGRVSAASLTATGAGVVSGGDVDVTGGIAVRGGGARTTLGALRARGGAVSVDGGSGDVTLGAVGASGGTTLRGASLNFGAVDGASLDALTPGALTGGDIAVTGAASLNGGTVTLGGVNAGNGATLRGATLAFGPVSGKSLDAVATGALTGGDVNVSGVASVGGGAVTLGDVATGGGATLRGTTLNVGAVSGSGLSATSTGALTVARVDVTGAASANAGSGALSLGPVTAGGAVTLAGGTVNVGAVNAASLDLTGSGTVTGGDVAATGAVSVRGGGDRLTLGQVRGNMVTLDSGGGALSIGALTSSGSAALSGGALAFGDANVGSLSAIASQGDITGGAITAVNDVAVTAQRGAVTLGTVNTTAGAVTIASVGTLRAQGVQAARTASLTTTARDADIIVADGIVSQDKVSVVSAGNIRAPLIRSRAGDLVVRAPNGEVSGLTLGSVTALSAGPGRAFELAVGTAARLGDISAGQTTISAASITAGRIDTGSEAITLRATDGDLIIGGLVTAGTATLSATGRTSLAAVDVAGNVALSGGTGLSFTDVSGGTVQAASGGTIAGRTINAGTILSVEGGQVSLGGAKAGQGLTLDATNGDLNVTGPVTAGTATLGATGRTILANVTSTGDVSLKGGTGLSFADVSGGTVQAVSGGAITGGTMTAGTTLTAEGAQVTLGSAKAGQGLTLNATTGDLTVTGPVSAGSATLGAAGRAVLADVATTGGLSIKGGASLSFANVSGEAVQASSGGAISGQSMTAATTLTAEGAQLSLGSVKAGQGVTLNATNGDLTVTGPVTAGTATLGATGRTVLATVTTTGDASLNGGTGLSFADVSGGAVRATSGGAINGQTATAGTTLSAQGTQVSLGSVKAGQGLTLNATNGDLSVTGPVTAGTATLGATGRTALANVATTGDLSLKGGTGLSFTDVSGGAVQASSGGAIGGQTMAAGTTLNAQGAQVTLAGATAGQGLTLAATGGDLSVGTLTSGGDSIVSASGLARVSGAVDAGGAYRVTGANVALGGGTVAQRAKGAVRITSATGDITGASGLTLASDADGVGAESLILDAGGAIQMAGTRLQARPGGGAALGLRVGAARAVQLGQVEAGSIGRFDGSTIGSVFTHDVGFTAGDLAVNALALRLSAGDLSLGEVRAGTVDLSSTGAVATGSITASGAAAVAGNSVTLPGIRAGAITLRSTGAVGGINGARTTLETTAGDLTVEAGAARLGDVRSAGAATLRGETVDVAGRLQAARGLLAEARRALAIGDAGAGDTMTLRAGEALTTGKLEAAGALNATGSSVQIGGARAATLAVTSTNALTLGDSSASGGATLEAGGLATLGALDGGPTVSVSAGDLDLSGAVRGTAVTLTNRAAATSAMRIGDGTEASGFRLSATELGRVSANRLTLNGGSGAVELGSVALAPAAVDVATTGDLRVTGAVTSGGTRALRLGGDASGQGSASTIMVEATSDAGGRLRMQDADLVLQGSRIAVGLRPGFIDTLMEGGDPRAQAAALLSTGNTALYNPQLGGGFYEPTATTTLEARSLTVRFGDYALFQNTGVPGRQSGLVLGSQTAPVTPALRVNGTGVAGNTSVALFGSINGIEGGAAALLGNPVIEIDPVLLPTTRINGCLAGTGTGCLTTIVIQPTLQVFNWNSEDVFGISQDVAVPFAPIVSGNNEDLLTGLPALAPEKPADRENAQ